MSEVKTSIHHNTAVLKTVPKSYPVPVDGNIKNQMFVPANKPTYRDTTNESNRVRKPK